MVICLERDADLRMAQLMLLPLTVSCVSRIQIGFTFLVPAHPGSPVKAPFHGCVCVSVCYLLTVQLGLVFDAWVILRFVILCQYWTDVVLIAGVGCSDRISAPDTHNDH